MSYALAYLGTLAFVAFVLWLRRPTGTEERLSSLEARYFNHAESELGPHGALGPDTAIPKRLAALESTVSTLAVGAGLRPNRPAEPKG